MPAERYFTTDLSVASDTITLQGDEFHHVIRVMRTREGDVVEFVDGAGLLATARLTSVGKSEALFDVEGVVKAPAPTREVVLVQAMPKLPRLEFVAEKGTELGMTSLWVFPGDNSEKEGLSKNQLERLQAILIASMKQCGRLYLPTIVVKPKLSAWKEMPHQGYYGDVRPEAPHFEQVMREQRKAESIWFFVGPESGFSKGEVECLERGGVKGVHLHDNILRTDTAAMVALVLAT